MLARSSHSPAATRSHIQCCYGCHEHTPAKIRAEHQEEGIRDFEKYVDCHYDPRAEPQRCGVKDDDKRNRD